MRRILAVAGCAGLLGLMHPATPGWAVTGNEWTALDEDQQAMYLIGVLDQWKWAVGLFDAAPMIKEGLDGAGVPDGGDDAQVAAAAGARLARGQTQ